MNDNNNDDINDRDYFSCLYFHSHTDNTCVHRYTSIHTLHMKKKKQTYREEWRKKRNMELVKKQRKEIGKRKTF